MNRLLAVIAAALVAVAVYAVAAPASEQAVTPKQFAALSKRVKNLERELVALEGCLGALPVKEYGDEQNQTEGYVYVNSSNPNGFLTTALDVTDAAHAQAFAIVTNAQCAPAFTGGKLKVPMRPHRSR